MSGSKVVRIIFRPRKQKVTRIYVRRFVIYTQGSPECTENEKIYFYRFPPSLKKCFFEGFRKPGPRELKFLAASYFLLFIFPVRIEENKILTAQSLRNYKIKVKLPQ